MSLGREEAGGDKDNWRWAGGEGSFPQENWKERGGRTHRRESYGS